MSIFDASDPVSTVLGLVGPDEFSALLEAAPSLACFVLYFSPVNAIKLTHHDDLRRIKWLMYSPSHQLKVPNWARIWLTVPLKSMDLIEVRYAKIEISHIHACPSGPLGLVQASDSAHMRSLVFVRDSRNTSAPSRSTRPRRSCPSHRGRQACTLSWMKCSGT